MEDTEGPIALIMVPTRELGIQVYNEVRRFAKVLDLRVCALAAFLRWLRADALSLRCSVCACMAVLR